MGLSSHGLRGFLARLSRPPASDSDADLLDRFIRSADETAFIGLVRRHGPMVLAVCRRRLGQDADADDAFQAVFLALSRSARSIGRGESLPGWLYRVAYFISLKAAGRRARHPAVTLSGREQVAIADRLMPACEAEELKTTIDSELARLPDKFRSVVVLCLIEGRTNAEAANILGVPVGTVDSRLNTARKKLQAALTRRGVAVGVSMTLTQMLGGPLGATDGPRFVELLSHSVRAVFAENAGPAAEAVSPAVAELVTGVAMMTTPNFRLLVALGLMLGVLSGAGAGIYLAIAADSPQPNQPVNPFVAEGPKGNSNPPGLPSVQQLEPGRKESKGTSQALDRPFGVKFGNQSVQVGDLLEQIEDLTDLVVRVDLAAFKRLGLLVDFETPGQFLKQFNANAVVLPRKAEKLSIRDILADSLAQVSLLRQWPVTYQVRGSQLIILPGYVPVVPPGNNPLDLSEEVLVALPRNQIDEQVYGGVVSLTVDRKPLTEVLAELRQQTGANIVLDPRYEKQGGLPPVTITLNDVRLYDALRVIADLVEQKLVYSGNIYYITTPENAKQFQPITSRPPLGPIGTDRPLPEPGK
jgi:RNA polymerase sigma factor (sigma-70 family)